MPRIKSAKKALRQSRTRADHNRALRSSLRSTIKKARTAAAADAPSAYAAAVRALDRAARTGIIHRNAAARQKSRLAKVVKAKQ